MPYSEALDSRIISALSVWGTTRTKMFGGTCHLIHGNMMCGGYKDFLVLRLGEKQGNDALKSFGCSFVCRYDASYLKQQRHTRLGR